ncbi:MAG: NAD(P)H-dependent oxidoreductase subunit E [Candidatus Omnitrophota bacterium]|nr:NAD(P)H-dependent oxidoreductase subunit E [Candidatus Omnitrophota bacterium]MBU2528433.1 NAD(P)H-dependent oxidoreductase subunit E [bacterium]MBU3930778.1 NAD(P)H-dependent oxidoreductase subunit E [bacterium]MBU4123289.1 NAD(P)H-dependent oxidoreductase subunit E [bacterium]
MTNLIRVLQDIQRECGYLKREKLEEVSHRLDIPMSRIYSVATFYKSFSLVPPAKHKIMVCMGTACYVRGAPRIVERITQVLGINPGDSTKDGNFKLETVNCIGACALGPLVMIDDDYHGKMTPQKIVKVLEKYK